jgi:hypothetical protein
MPTKEFGTSYNQNFEDQRKKEVRLAKKLTFLVGFLIASYLPMFSVFLVLGFNPKFCPLEIFMLLAWLRYFTSCVNPLIYSYQVPGYKKAFRCMFRGGEEKRRGSKSNKRASVTVTSGSML